MEQRLALVVAQGERAASSSKSSWLARSRPRWNWDRRAPASTSCEPGGRVIDERVDDGVAVRLERMVHVVEHEHERL